MTLFQVKRRKWIARWHRRLALVVCLWLMVLAASGLMINHANDWGLDRKALPSGLQQSVYGLDSNTQINCGGTEISSQDCRSIFARFEVPHGILLVSEYHVHWFAPEGPLIESVPGGNLGLTKLEGAYLDSESLYLRGNGELVVSDLELLGSEVVSAAKQVELSRSDWQSALTAETYISWERFLLDLHAGRFLGPVSVWFSDMMAILILLLALSGCWLYLRKRNGNGKNNGNGNGNSQRM